MAIRFKFVAAVLVLFLLAGTGSLVAACVQQVRMAAAMHCPPGCPMMTAHRVSAEVGGNQKQQTAPCCQFRSDKSVPTALPATGTTTVYGRVLQAKAIPAMPLSVAPARKAEPVPIAADASPQAVLCTFLI